MYANRFIGALLLYILLTTPFKSGAQGKTIIIDTLSGFIPADIDDSKNQYGWYELSMNNRYDGMEELYSESIDTTVFPNVIITGFTENDIRLRLDNKGGIFELRGVQMLVGDTIRINKWRIYRNGLTDTLKGSSGYYKQVNDSLVPNSGKFKDFVRYKKHNGVNSLPTIEIVVNGKLYVIPVATQKSESETWGHGHKPYAKYERYIVGKSKKRVNRFKRIVAGHTTTAWLFEATLDL